MNAQTSSSREQGPKQRPVAAGQRILLSLQLVLVCGVAIVGGQALFSMLNPTPSSPGRPVSTTALLPRKPMALAAEGTWTLGNLPLSLGVEVVATDSLWERMAVEPLGRYGVDEASDAALLSVLKRACGRGEAMGSCTTYTLDQPRLKLRAFSSGSGDQERLVGGYLAYPRGPEAWTLVAATRSCSDASVSGQRHLLPIADYTESIGTRVGHDGRLQCEIVEAYGDLELTLQAWRQAGWTVHQVDEEPTRVTLLCSQADRHIQVHARRDPREDMRHTLLLVDTNAILDIESESILQEGRSS